MSRHDSPILLKTQQITVFVSAVFYFTSKSHWCSKSRINTGSWFIIVSMITKWNFSIIYCDKRRDCIPYNYFVITVTLCLEYLRTAHVFFLWISMKKKWRFSLKIFSCACLQGTWIWVIVHTMFLWCGCTSSIRQHMLPVFKILTMSEQERVFVLYLPYSVCPLSSLCHGHESPLMEILCKYRSFSASLRCQRTVMDACCVQNST